MEEKMEQLRPSLSELAMQFYEKLCVSNVFTEEGHRLVLDASAELFKARVLLGLMNAPNRKGTL